MCEGAGHEVNDGFALGLVRASVCNDDDAFATLSCDLDERAQERALAAAAGTGEEDGSACAIARVCPQTPHDLTGDVLRVEVVRSRVSIDCQAERGARAEYFRGWGSAPSPRHSHDDAAHGAPPVELDVVA